MLKKLKLIGNSLFIFAMVFAVSCKDDGPAPIVVIDSIESENFYPGEDVILKGQNFNTVLFTFLEKNQIPFQLEGGAIIVKIPETSPIGTTVLTLVMADGYTETADIDVVARPFPVIQSISPSAAPEGGQVTLTGTSLDNLVSVTIGGANADVVSSSASELVVTVPSGLAEGVPNKVIVTTNGGEGQTIFRFCVGQNLLLNGELELGSGNDFDNWGKWNGADFLTATTALGEAYAGRSLRAVGDGRDAWRTQFVVDEFLQYREQRIQIVSIGKRSSGSPGLVET
ncbi:MAG: IPT/TIG domain-containing protein [Bacteroidia bacterium]